MSDEEIEFYEIQSFKVNAIHWANNRHLMNDDIISKCVLTKEMYKKHADIMGIRL